MKCENIDITKELLNSREEWVFDYLFNKYYKPLVGFAIKMLKSNLIAEDLIQDCFLLFWCKAGLTGTFETEIQVKAYLYISASGKCKNLLKSQKRFISIEQEEIEKRFVEDYTDMERIRTLYGLIEYGMTHMPRQMKLVAQKVFLEEKSIKQIAGELQISTSTAKNQYNRAKDRIVESYRNLNERYSERQIKKEENKDEIIERVILPEPIKSPESVERNKQIVRGPQLEKFLEVKPLATYKDIADEFSIHFYDAVKMKKEYERKKGLEVKEESRYEKYFPDLTQLVRREGLDISIKRVMNFFGVSRDIAHNVRKEYYKKMMR